MSNSGVVQSKIDIHNDSLTTLSDLFISILLSGIGLGSPQSSMLRGMNRF